MPSFIPLGVILYPAGHHVAAWLSPGAQVDAAVDIGHYQHLARIAEAAKLDFVFVSDRLGIPDTRADALSRVDEWSHGFEALTLASALAASTSHIGIVATASTTFTEPYALARQIASIDLLSRGRMGWNLVTSSLAAEAANFSSTADFAHARRYERASEFLDVVLGLWDSWDADAFLRDRSTGKMFDSDKLRRLDHEGKHFRSRGPLNVPPSAQRRPVVVQAGSSEAGKDLAARSAEIVFTAQPILLEAAAFYRDLKARCRATGRDESQMLIMPGLSPIIGRSRQEADEKREQLQSLIHPAVSLALLETYLGDVDLSNAPLDGPLPPLPPSNSIKSRQALLVDLAHREKLTIRQLAKRVAGARGHLEIVGTPVDIADQIEAWVQQHAADGFAILPPTFPHGLEDFADHVMPELRRRGLTREEYAGATLREHLRLATPISRYATQHDLLHA